MRRVFNGLAASAVVLLLAVSPASAAPKRDAGTDGPSVVRRVIEAIRRIVGKPVDDLTWPKP